MQNHSRTTTPRATADTVANGFRCTVYQGERELPAEKDDPPEGGSGNKGTMILDATVAPADIRYPTDISLLNECREGTEKIIDNVTGFTRKRYWPI